MMRLRLALLLALLVASTGAVAETAEHGWKTQGACEASVQGHCVLGKDKVWQPSTHAKPAKHGAAAIHKPSPPMVEAVKPAAAPANPTAVTATSVETSHPSAAPVEAQKRAVTPASSQAVQKEEGGFFSRLFGGGKKAQPAPESKSVTEHAAAPANLETETAPQASVPGKKPSMIVPFEKPAPPPVDPEQVLRGKVWTSEAACKKEALKGNCIPLDCATHTGGACSGFTSMVWLYR